MESTDARLSKSMDVLRLGLALIIATAWPLTAKPEPVTPILGQAAPKTPPTSLADLPALATTTETLTNRINTDLPEIQAHLGDAPLVQLEEAIRPRVAQALAAGHLSESDLSTLVDVEAELSSQALALDRLITGFQSSIRQLDDFFSEVGAERQQWDSLERLSRERTAPPEYLLLISKAQQTLTASSREINATRDGILTALSRAVSVHASLDRLSHEIATRRQVVAGQLLDENREPLFALPRPNTTRLQNASKALESWLLAINRHVASHLMALVVMASLLGAASVALSRLGVLLLKDNLALPGLVQGALRIAVYPFWLAVMTLLLGLNFGPKGPVAFYDALWLLMLAPMTALSRALFSSDRWLSVYGLALSLIPFPFRTILEAMPWVDRWILNLQAGIVITTLTLDFMARRKMLRERASPLLFTAITLGLISLLGLAIWANLRGWTGLSREIVDGIIGSLGFLLIYSLAREILFLYAAGLIRSPLGRLLRTATTDPNVLLYEIHRVLRWASILMVIWGSLYAFRIDVAVKSWSLALWGSSLGLGQVEIPIKIVFTAFGIMAATLVTLRFTRFALEREILPRFQLATGVPFAIVTLAQYAVGFTGFLLTMTAIGIDLTKISILAGALGVGVGFGLQNIFNNFISGLILLFERPIHVGDIVEVGNLRGSVTRIGIRSSTIRVPTGAEVLVPNGDLIAKEVINWTLSDRKRRIEICVGTAYGTAASKVIETLVDVSEATDGVLSEPLPLAVFANFGESSLDFVLYVWVDHYEDSLQVASKLRERIHARFREEGIEIPYPQRDLHIRSQAGVSTA